MKSNLLLVVYLVIAVLLYPFLKYYVDSADTLQYITIAKNYSAGNFADAVNSFWSPMIAWLLVPFVLFGIEPVFAFKILQVIIGVFTLRLVYYHIDRSNSETYIRTALKAACIPLVLSFAFLFSTPDLLLLTLYVWLVALLKNDRSPLLVGICGAALYFTKGFGFAFFIAASTAAYLYKYFSQEIQKKRLASDILKAYGIFFLLCAPWIYVISEKENKFLFSMKSALPAFVLRTGCLLFCNANCHGSAFNFFVVQALHRCLAFGHHIHFDKTKTTALARLPVCDHLS